MTQLFGFLPPQPSSNRHTTNSNYKRPTGKRKTNASRGRGLPGNRDFNGTGILPRWTLPEYFEHGGSLARASYLKH